MTSSHRDFVLGVAACLAVGATLVGCGGGGGGGGFPLLVPPAAGQPAAPPPPAPPPVAGLACEQLQGLAIPASAIGLPTSGASVTSAKTVAPGGTGAAALPEYCEVAGKIAPVDATAPDIRFALALPTAWNRKVVMLGGGGFNGTVPNVKGNVPNGPADKLTPLGRGYATFASDSGHQANALGSQDGLFGLNDEAVRNFGGDALKKTHDAALAVIKEALCRGTGQVVLRGRLHRRARGADRHPALARGLGRRHRVVPRVERRGRAAGRPPHEPRAGAARCVPQRREARGAVRRGHGNLRRARRRHRRAHQQPDAVQRALRSGHRHAARRAGAMRRRHRGRRHLPVGRADRCDEDHQHADQLPLRAGQRRDAVPRLQHLGRRPGHHHPHLAAASRR
jgi:hypothetical protein